jgi:RNA polymerase sigma-70 factor (ECF subfamily)
MDAHERFSEPADAELVARALAGDREGFAALYDRYAPRVRARCWARTGDVETARDLAQEAFLRAYGRLGGLRRPERFAAWLLAIAERVCWEWRRWRRRHPAARLDENALAPAAEPRAGADEIERLRAALERLPAKLRRAVELCHLERLEVEAARRELGVSRSGIYKLLAQARERLRRILETEERSDVGSSRSRLPGAR